MNLHRYEFSQEIIPFGIRDNFFFFLSFSSHKNSSAFHGKMFTFSDEDDCMHYIFILYDKSLNKSFITKTNTKNDEMNSSEIK